MTGLALRLGSLAYGLTMAIEQRVRGLRHRTVDVDGLAVSLLEGGRTDAPTIVMLHGYSADKDVWVRFAGPFVRDFHVIVPDLAGHGATPFVTGADFSGPAQADRVARLLDVLGIDRAHVIGNSMGGFIAATLALRHPDRVLSIGLSDAAGVTAPEPAAAEELLAQGNNPFLFDDRSEFDVFYALTMAKPPWVPRIVKASMGQDYVDRRDQLAEIWTDFRTPEDWLDERLGQIAAPAWVMWGTEDQLVHPSAAQVWADGLPHATVTEYDGIGHMPMLEIPAQSAADYRRFLDGI